MNSAYKPHSHVNAEGGEKCEACEKGDDRMKLDGLTLFTTATCPRCKAIKALFEKAGVEYTTVDCYENQSLVGAYGITNAPTLVVPKKEGGFEIYRGESEIRGFYDANLRK